MTHAVLQAVCEFCQAVELPDPWSFLQPSPHVFRLPGDVSDLFGDLEDRFTEEQLEQVELLVRDEQGELQRSQTFFELAPGFLSLHRRQGDAPYDLVGANTSLIENQPACFQAYQDAFTKSECRASGGRIFIASDISTVAVLRSLGLAATTAAGMYNLDGQQLRFLCGPPQKLAGMRDYGNEPQQATQRADICQRRVKLAFVGWKITEFDRSPPDSLLAIVNHLAEANEIFGFELRQLSVWYPTKQLVEEIQLAARLRGPRLVRKSIVETLDTATFEVTQFHQAFKPAPRRRKITFAAAWRELERECARACELQEVGPGLTKRLNELNTAFYDTVVAPLHNRAAATSDSVEAALLIAAAELSQEIHNSSTIVRSVREGNIRNGILENQMKSPEEWKHRRDLFGELRKIHEELLGK